MSTEQEKLIHLIQAAKNGDQAAASRLLEQHHDLLLLLAEREIGPALQRREGASDLVQRTEIEAYQSIRQFRGTSEPEFLAWIRRILRSNILNFVRDNRAAKRDQRRERYLDESNESATLTWFQPEDGRHASPSQRLIKAEAALKLAAGLAKLPDGQRVAVRMRHLEGSSLEEIAEALDKTQAAAAGLIRRGLQALCDSMPEDTNWM